MTGSVVCLDDGRDDNNDDDVDRLDRRRTVQFSDVVSIEFIPNVHDDYTEYERRSCWYTKNDLEKQRRLHRRIAEELGGFYTEEELFDRFGIHNKSKRAQRRHKTLGYISMLGLHGQQFIWNENYDSASSSSSSTTTTKRPSTSAISSELDDIVALMYSCETKVSAEIARLQAYKLHERLSQRIMLRI